MGVRLAIIGGPPHTYLRIWRIRTESIVFVAGECSMIVRKARYGDAVGNLLPYRCGLPIRLGSHLEPCTIHVRLLGVEERTDHIAFQRPFDRIRLQVTFDGPHPCTEAAITSRRICR